jgi:GNAT superfamily N-acetyltransferase
MIQGRPMTDMLSLVDGLSNPGDAGFVNRTQMERAAGHTATEIRQACSADLAALSDFFAGLSLRTRYLRFFAPVTPARSLIRRMAGVIGSTDAVVAIRDGRIIGHAMAVDRAASHGEPAADIGVVVADAWQSQGVGSALVRTLVSRAQARGVTSLTMDVLHGNHQVLAMIARHWTPAYTQRSADCVTVQVRLPRPSAAPGRCLLLLDEFAFDRDQSLVADHEFQPARRWCS